MRLDRASGATYPPIPRDHVPDRAIKGSRHFQMLETCGYWRLDIDLIFGGVENYVPPNLKVRLLAQKRGCQGAVLLVPPSPDCGEDEGGCQG